MRKNGFAVLIFLVFGTILIAAQAQSQLVIGQYEDEAPLQTWNTFGFQTAPLLGRGLAGYAVAADGSATFTNPALLTLLPKMTITLNGSFQHASLYKYSMVNTGVFNTRENSKVGFYALDFGGISVRLGHWAFGMAMALVESYDRPQIEYRYYYRGNLAYGLDFNQEGLLKNVNVSVARNFGRFSAGLGLNFVYGELKRDYAEQWIASDFTITDSISQKFQGFFINGGVVYQLTRKLDMALVFRTPHIKKSKSESLLRYSAASGLTDISIAGSSDDDKYKQPFVVGLGANYRLTEKFQVGADGAFYNWASYKVDYFQERKTRDFRNIIKISAGAEYLVLFRLFKQGFVLPLRLGFSYDPQPMKEPKSAYTNFAVGSGLRWKGVSFDISFLTGEESGSGNSLSAQKFVVSLSYQFLEMK